jgi:hypothetical protein
MPVERLMRITGRLAMLGDQCRVLIGRCGIATLDSSGQTSM